MAAEQKSETEKRIMQMVAFINQEARDKAEEIEVRAKEDVNVEVLKMQDREKAKLREYYKQQEKRVEIEAKIAKQQLLDSFRMKHLQIQDEKVNIRGTSFFAFVDTEIFHVAESSGLKESTKSFVSRKERLIFFPKFP
jgi:vacuolar-type H+-ATPase subunit E/Vma4